MKNSSTYQLILKEGRDEGLKEGRDEGLKEGRQEGQLFTTRELLIRFGTRRLGVPSDVVRTKLEAIEDVAVLEGYIDRLEAVESWSDLLPTK